MEDSSTSDKDLSLMNLRIKDLEDKIVAIVEQTDRDL